MDEAEFDGLFPARQRLISSEARGMANIVGRSIDFGGFTPLGGEAWRSCCGKPDEIIKTALAILSDGEGCFYVYERSDCRVNVRLIGTVFSEET